MLWVSLAFGHCRCSVKPMMKFASALAAALCLFAAHNAAAQPGTQADNGRNVLLITTDGLRWQEVFRGMDADMLTTENQVKNKGRLLTEYDAPTTEARREKLMPFLWSHVAKNGQIYGNRDKGSVAHVTNKMWFSYPGYNELLTGSADPRITTNKPLPNQNVTVFEWLGRQPAINGKVAAFTGWTVHAAIYNTGRCGFPVDAGGLQFKPSTGLTPKMEVINEVRSRLPVRWVDECFDGVVYPMFTEYVRTQKPRVVHLGFLETDAWGHEGNYEQYLQSAHRVDATLKELWDMLQAMPEYRDKTTVIFTTDHGRGDTAQNAKAWNSHGAKIDGSDAIFLAMWGPDTPATGEITSGVVTQSQVAATVAAALGYDFNAENPQAAQPLEGALKK